MNLRTLFTTLLINGIMLAALYYIAESTVAFFGIGLGLTLGLWGGLQYVIKSSVAHTVWSFSVPEFKDAEEFAEAVMEVAKKGAQDSSFRDGAIQSPLLALLAVSGKTYPSGVKVIFFKCKVMGIIRWLRKIWRKISNPRSLAEYPQPGTYLIGIPEGWEPTGYATIKAEVVAYAKGIGGGKKRSVSDCNCYPHTDCGTAVECK